MSSTSNSLVGKFIAATTLTTGASHILAPADTAEEAQRKLDELLVLLGNPETNFTTISQVVIFKSALLDMLDSLDN